MPANDYETNSYENARVALAMKVGRTAIGCNQGEFARLLGVSKPTIARIETMELAVRFDLYAHMVELLKQFDVFVDAVSVEGAQLHIGRGAVEGMIRRLEDDANRRSDRKVGKNVQEASGKQGSEEQPNPADRDETN